MGSSRAEEQHPPASQSRADQRKLQVLSASLTRLSSAKWPRCCRHVDFVCFVVQIGPL